MSLQNSLYITDKFVELEPIIENVKEDVSFWGTRYVYLEDCEDRFPIDILAGRVIELVKKTKFEFSDEERAAGKKIAAKIDQIYLDNDNRLEEKWLITRILCYLKDNFSNYPPRFYWECFEGKAFDYYTASQYCSTFQHPLPNSPHASIGYVGLGKVELYREP